MSLRNDSIEAEVSFREQLLRVSAAEAAALSSFEGKAAEGDGRQILEGPLSAANAAALRAAFPNLRPALISKSLTSVGTGDRLGLATPGHVAAFQQVGGNVMPVFAQQSIREMDRLGRNAQSVMDAATFGQVAGGWDGPAGADCDHIKTTEGIDRGLAAGFTMFTLDPGDHVVDVAQGFTQQQIDELPWGQLEDDVEALKQRYVGKTLDLAGQQVQISEEEILAAAVKYGGAVADSLRLYRHLKDNATYETEVEFAVDETAFVTSFVEHYYITNEYRRLGLEFFSFAPRYADGFEKGVEYLGDADALRANLEGHRAVAELLGGYKISLHSGSDKFSIYPLAVEATKGQIHLKTSGTSYLCALDVVARREPELLAEFWAVSRPSYVQARASYQVSADENKTPVSLESVTDLPGFVEAFDSRQILHVGYGDSLNAAGLRDRLLALLREHHDDHTSVLTAHLARHIEPFAKA